MLQDQLRKQLTFSCCAIANVRRNKNPDDRWYFGPRASCTSVRCDLFQGPDKYTYASPGNGTPQHLAMELFKLNAQVSLRHVPYKGSAGAITDLLGGHVDTMILPANTAMTHKSGGKLRVLAVLNDKRVPVMPDVPTLSEQGVHKSEVDLWFGLLAPAQTPPAVIARINAEMAKALKTSDVREALDSQGLTVSPSTPEELGKLVADESVRWANVIKSARITAD